MRVTNKLVVEDVAAVVDKAMMSAADRRGLRLSASHIGPRVGLAGSRRRAQIEMSPLGGTRETNRKDAPDDKQG
jgi:hypothetical protein